MYAKKRNGEKTFFDLALIVVFFFQYYEMSYGLNIEMHKQVGSVLLLEC